MHVMSAGTFSLTASCRRVPRVHSTQVFAHISLYTSHIMMMLIHHCTRTRGIIACLFAWVCMFFGIAAAAAFGDAFVRRHKEMNERQQKDARDPSHIAGAHIQHRTASGILIALNSNGQPRCGPARWYGDTQKITNSISLIYYIYSLRCTITIANYHFIYAFCSSFVVGLQATIKGCNGREECHIHCAEPDGGMRHNCDRRKCMCFTLLY